jgi:hypothetical protein
MNVLLDADVFLLLDAALAVGLMSWLLRLVLHPRPFAEHVAFVAATVYPMLLGLLEAGLEAYRYLVIIGTEGAGGPGTIPSSLEACWTGGILALVTGTGITCLYFPLGVLAIILHQRLIERLTHGLGHLH